jgi:hypothetical protein
MDRLSAPPHRLVEAAEDIFSGPAWDVPSESMWAGLRRFIGELTWDSDSQPVPAGLRGARPDCRHSVFHAGRYSVDLRVDSEPGSTAVTLTGQIADEATPDAPVSDIRAVLLAGRRPIATVPVTPFGEFSLRCEPRRGLRLLIPLVSLGECVEVPLKLPKAVNR